MSKPKDREAAWRSLKRNVASYTIALEKKKPDPKLADKVISSIREFERADIMPTKQED
jgi:hypothetical protein